MLAKICHVQWVTLSWFDNPTKLLFTEKCSLFATDCTYCQCQLLVLYVGNISLTKGRYTACFSKLALFIWNYFFFFQPPPTPALFIHCKLSLLAHFCTALKEALVRSISPPVGLSTRPITPFPVPFTNPHTPSFFAPADKGSQK